MLSGIINFTFKVMGKLPLVGRFFRGLDKPNQTHNREELNNWHQNIKADQKDIVVVKHGKKDQGLKAIQSYLSAYENKKVIFKRFPSFSSELEQHIKKIGANTPVEFKTNLLINSTLKFFNNLSDSFKKKLDLLNSAVFTDKSHLAYIELLSDFTTEAKRLILEVSDTIMQKTASLDGVSDVDIANSLLVCKELSKSIAKQTLNTVIEGTLELPLDVELTSKDGKTSIGLRELISSEFEHEFLSLHLASQFGMHSKQAIDGFMTRIEHPKNKLGTDLYENLIIINKLQEAIHGSVLQDRNDPGYRSNEIAILNLSILKDSLTELIKIIIKSMELRKERSLRAEKYHEMIKLYEESEKDIKDFLFKCGAVEKTVLDQALNIEKDSLWEQLGISPEGIGTSIKSTYQHANSLINYLGEMQSEEILGYEIKGTSVLNLFNSSNTDNDVHFKRLILEISLLAALDAINTHRKNKPADDDFTATKKSNDGNILPATKNFTSIPWLKSLYESRYNYFSDLIKRDPSEYKTALIAIELSKLGNELHKTKYFTAKSFFSRYGIDKYGDHMVNTMGGMTDIGKMALNIDLFSNLFSYLDTKEYGNLSSDEIQNIKSLIKYLRKECEIIDDNGQVIYDPPPNNKPAKRTYDKMRAIFADRGFLTLNSPLLISFLRDTFGRNDPLDKPLSQESFASKNRVLASWLFYMLVKFLPEHSNDTDSLKARVQIFRQLMDEKFQSKERVLEPLFKKMARQARGISEDGDYPNEYGRRGVIKSLCLELENKIQKYANGETCSIPLADLLEQYHIIEKCIHKNPKSKAKILEIQKNIFKNNDPLLKPLADSLINIMDADPIQVVQFAKHKSQENPLLCDRLAHQLLNKISNLCSQIKFERDSTIIIKDSDQNQIERLSKILEYSIYLGYLLNNLNQNYTNIQASDFKDPSARTEVIQGQLQTLNRIINSQVLLQHDEKYPNEIEAFPNQLDSKNKLLHLLNKPYFKINPALGNNFAWLDRSQEQKLRTQSKQNFATAI